MTSLSTEKYLRSCFSDYEEGDRAGYIDQHGDIILGTVLVALENEIIFRLDTGEDVSVTAKGNFNVNPWCSALYQWRKVIDTSLVREGTTLSKLTPIDLENSERVYSVVASIVPDKKIVLLDSRNFYTTLELDASNGITLETALFFWEVEL